MSAPLSFHCSWHKSELPRANTSEACINSGLFHLSIRGADSKDHLPPAKSNPFPISFSPDLLFFYWFNTRPLPGQIVHLYLRFWKTHKLQKLFVPLHSRLMKVPLRKSHKALYEFCRNESRGDVLTRGVGGQQYRVTTKTHAPDLDSDVGSTLHCLRLDKSTKAS